MRFPDGRRWLETVVPGLVLLVLIGSTTEPAAAQIVVRIFGGTPNIFAGPGNALPVNAQVNAGNDVFIEDDLEVGGTTFLDRILYINREPQDTDQRIYFSDDAAIDGEMFGWDNSADAFTMTNDLDLFEGEGATARIRARAENELQLLSETYEMFFLIDSDADDDASILDHVFTWANNNFNPGQRAMVLRSVTGDVGDLEIAGSFSSNTNFDLAESFWMSEPARSGELVAVDPSRPDAVVLADSANASRLLGVVSTAPGFVLGGGAFSPEALAESWGEETARRLESERTRLEVEILSENQALRRQAVELESFGGYQSALLTRAAERRAGEPPEPADDDSDTRARTDWREPSLEQYEEAVERFATRLDDAVMRRFFRRHFAPVALAGRVPVEVDAGYGAIRPGDPLTVSDTPGIARRADRPAPVVGTALEGLARGRGKILMLVHRGWVAGGEVGRLAAAEPGGAASVEEIRALRAENRRLASRLAAIEAALEERGRGSERVAARR